MGEVIEFPVPSAAGKLVTDAASARASGATGADAVPRSAAPHSGGQHPDRPRPEQLGAGADTSRPAITREPLLRQLLGGLLREERRAQERILTEVARSAGVSPQYLSEIERGRKEPSSEILAAVADALGLSLFDVAVGIAGRLAAERGGSPSASLDLTSPRGLTTEAAPALPSAPGDAFLLAV